MAIAIKNVGGNAGAEKLLLDALIVRANIAVRDGNITATVGTIIVSNAKLWATVIGGIAVTIILIVVSRRRSTLT